MAPTSVVGRYVLNTPLAVFDQNLGLDEDHQLEVGGHLTVMIVAMSVESVVTMHMTVAVAAGPGHAAKTEVGDLIPATAPDPHKDTPGQGQGQGHAKLA